MSEKFCRLAALAVRSACSPPDSLTKSSRILRPVITFTRHPHGRDYHKMSQVKIEYLSPCRINVIRRQRAKCMSTTYLSLQIRNKMEEAGRNSCRYAGSRSCVVHLFQSRSIAVRFEFRQRSRYESCQRALRRWRFLSLLRRR
jgi:hypothetical protein